MPHFRVDDALHSHPKARQAGLEAMGLWNMCGSYCMGYLTDGFVPEWYVVSWPKGRALAKRLVDARLWAPATRGGEKGWQFHEFVGPGRQDSRAEIDASREKWRKKKAGQREMSPGDNQRVSPGDTSGESPGDSLRVTRDPTQPNPTEEISGHLPEASTQSNARDSAAATPGAEIVNELVGPEHPDAVRTVLRIRASELIRQGHPRTDVAAAVALWLTKPTLGPNALPTLVSEAVKSRAAPNGKPHKLRGLAELAREVRVSEEALAETPARKEIR